MDGSELSIQSSPVMVSFKDARGVGTRFSESDQLPISVRRKLEVLPVVMDKLGTAQMYAPVQ